MENPPFLISAHVSDDEFPARCAGEDLDAQKYEPAPPTDKATKLTNDLHRRHVASAGLVALLFPNSAESTTLLVSKLSKSSTVIGMISTSRN